MSFNDNLQPLPLEKWHLLAETLNKNWPLNVQYYYFIETSLRWKLKDPNIAIEIYCPGGDYNSGIFVGISSCARYFMVFFAHEGFEELLYKAVREATFINWNKSILFPAVHSLQSSTVHSIIDFLKLEKGSIVIWSAPGDCYFKSKEECAKVDVQLPDDCYLKELDETHVPLIHSKWAFKDEQNPEISTKEVLNMVQHNGGLGLFSKDKNELLSWVTQSEFGALGLVQTIERCRRKGYAKIVTNAFAKILALKGIDPFLFIAEGNHQIPELLFKSLGWTHLHTVDWHVMYGIQQNDS